MWSEPPQANRLMLQQTTAPATAWYMKCPRIARVAGSIAISVCFIMHFSSKPLDEKKVCPRCTSIALSAHLSLPRPSYLSHFFITFEVKAHTSEGSTEHSGVLAGVSVPPRPLSTEGWCFCAKLCDSKQHVYLMFQRNTLLGFTGVNVNILQMNVFQHPQHFTDSIMMHWLKRMDDILFEQII